LGPGPCLVKKKIYRSTLSQRLRNADLVTFSTMQKLFRFKFIRGWWGAGNLEGWRGRSRGQFSAWYFDIRKRWG